MLAPPSLSREIVRRAYRAPNGELGVGLGDVEGFLATCAQDRIAILGWEVWLIDHEFDFDAATPVPRPGQWCGLIPLASSSGTAVMGGNTGERQPAEQWTTFVDRSIAEVREQFAGFAAMAEIDGGWRPHLRVNFTVASESD